MDVARIVVLAGYATLVLELLFFAVPSEASARRLLAAPEGRGLRSWMRYGLPTAVVVLLFLVPPAAAFAPGLLDGLGRLRPLEGHATAALGAGLVLAGRAVTFLSLLELRRILASGPGSVQARGFYGRSRNPGLLGMYAFYLGNVLVFPCAVLLAGFPFYVWTMHGRVLLEERHLAAAAGPSWEAYRARVPRYLPRLGGGA